MSPMSVTYTHIESEEIIMTLEIKISDIKNAMEETFDDGHHFDSFEQELEYVNEKYKAEYIKYCEAKHQKLLESDEYIPEDAGFFEALKKDFIHIKHVISRIFRGDIYEPKSKDEWIIPYDSVNDAMHIEVHIPLKEWRRLKRKWKV
jgi:hypothetical protein